MSDYHRKHTSPTARNSHICIACGYKIYAGEKYIQQEGFYEGSAYRVRYHNECWEFLDSEEIFEFSVGDVDPPSRILAMQRGDL